MDKFNIIVDYDNETETLEIIDGYTDERKKIYNVKSIEDVRECINCYLEDL